MIEVPNTLDELFDGSIREASEWVTERESYTANENLVQIREMAGQMAGTMLENLKHLGNEVMLNRDWVAGFVSGIMTAVVIMRDEDLALDSRSCEEGHQHLILDGELTESYCIIAMKGIVETYQMLKALEDMTGGL